jgi:hypothetical protein
MKMIRESGKAKSRPIIETEWALNILSAPQETHVKCPCGDPIETIKVTI